VQRRSLTARVAAALGVAALLLAVGGVAAARFGFTSPFAGFRIFGLGFLLAPLGQILGVVGLVRSRGGADPTGREAAWVGLVASSVVAFSVLVVALPAARLPAINDITTDPADPPEFRHAAREAANRGRDLSYPGGAVAEAQRAAYPDLAPIELPAPPEEAFRRAMATAEALGWTIVYRDPEAGILEANDTSALFRFVDDIAVRIRPAPGGSVVDIRSRSRDGRGDLGANARRIRRFRDLLRAPPAP